MVCVTARRSQALLASDPVLAQQVTGTPGSPEATTTIEGNLRHVGCDPARLILGKPDGGGDHRSAIGRKCCSGLPSLLRFSILASSSFKRPKTSGAAPSSARYGGCCQGNASSALLRLYSPLEPWFNKTWRPGEIEPYSRP